MSDGHTLSAHLFLPVAPGPFPAVFDYYPYRKDDLSAAGLSRHHYLAQQGYAALRLDVRGTGSSSGTASDEYTLQEQRDGVEAIAWMAAQPWCSGNVGMFGASYGGFNSLQIAMHRPPALKAICPMYFTDNRYTDDCHYKGGALQMLYDIGTYGLGMVVMNALPPYPEGAGENWADSWESHLQSEPWLLTWLQNQTYNDYWRHGSLCEDYDAVDCAAYLFGGWRDGYTNCNLRVFQHLQCPKKVLIGPWLHNAPDTGIPGPQVDFLHEMVRFYDFWLKGIDNGIMEEPPVTVYVQQYDRPEAQRALTSGFWRHEAGWPLDRSRDVPFFLTGSGQLQPAPPTESATVTYAYSPSAGTTFGMFSAGAPYVLPLDQRLEEAFVEGWSTKPLAESVEILGRARAELTLSVTTDVATVVVRLLDVAPDGIAALVTKGVLNLTHRYSHENPSPVEPGKVHEISIPFDATGWVFEPGHVIRLTVCGADFPNTWPSPLPYTGRVRCGPAAGSRLVLPVLGPQDPALPQPQLRSPAQARPLLQSVSDQPVWRVTRDHMAGTTEVTMRTAGHTQLGETGACSQDREVTALVSERNPALASVRGLSQAMLHWPDRTIKAVARGQIQSTAEHFHVTIHLSLTLDDRPHVNKRWVRTIPRHLL